MTVKSITFMMFTCASGLVTNIVFLFPGDHSSTENVFSTSSTLPLSNKNNSLQNVQEPQSPGTSNYVNIEYFIQ